MDTIEVPEHFICPVSLQIMKDPVTAVSGITYDRESIEHWLLKNHNTICPVTKQPLPPDSAYLTPNHTLRRLIQDWCNVNAAYVINRIPAPKLPLDEFIVIKLIRELGSGNGREKVEILIELERLATENDGNEIFMVEAGLIKGEIDEIVDSLVWTLGIPGLKKVIHAAYALKSVIQKADQRIMERLKPEVLRDILSNTKSAHICPQARNTLLHVLLEACPWGRNRAMLIEFGAVFDLIEIEIKNPEKKTTELVLGILYHLCCCADGRARLLNHAAGIAVITARILKVSSTADDRVLLIIWQICRYSATKEVLEEMLRIGTVAKLCVLMQANCGSHLKEKAREILRAHSGVWKDSPCIEVPTLTVYTRRFQKKDSLR